MRVAIDARLVTYQPAGIGNYVVSLLMAMRDLVAPGSLHVLVSREERALRAAIEPLACRSLWTPPHHRFEQAALALELITLNVDVYHATDFIPPFFRRFPAVITVHDLAFLRMPELLTSASRRYYGQIGRAVRSATRIIAVSDCTRRDLIELVGAPPDRIDVVHEAADARYRPAPAGAVADVRRRSRVADQYFLCVGTIEPRKNLGRLLDAYARLVKRAPGAPGLVIAGRKGWLAEDLDGQIRRLGLTERVRWLGRVADDDLVALYTGALALIFPSLYEGFGLPALEAMACGTAVVASTGGSLPEIVGDAGLLVDPYDVAALAAAIERVWREDALRADLEAQGIARAREFTWRQAAEATLDVYRRAA